MANPTTNYGFVLPTATDLVTDLPADFDVALQGVDTRLKALQPGTTLGDLAYSSATANTNTRLGIGSTGQVLTVASGVPSWATPASTAKIVQIVTAETTTETGNSTNVYSDTTLTASITPTSASNKILVIASHNGVGRTATSSASNVLIKLLRGATEIAGSFYIGETNTALRVYIGSTVITKMDTPATTSAITYKTQFMNGGNAAAAYVQLGSSTSTIVLMEVAP
jgi:hypothetical protein